MARSLRTFLGRVLPVVAVTAVCAAVVAGSAGATPARVEGHGLTRLDRGLCDLAGFHGVDAAAEWLGGRLAHDEVRGGEIGSFVLTSIEVYCDFPDHLRVATDAVRTLFGTQKPSTQNSTDAIRGLFAQQDAGVIALQMFSLTGTRWTAAGVRSLVGRICRDARSYGDPVGRDLAPALPRATIAALPTVNAIIGRTVRCQPSLSAGGANFVSAAAYNYLVANTYADLEPPVAVFTGIHGVRYTDRMTRVAFSWLAVDRAGSVQSLVVYTRTGNGSWVYGGTLSPDWASATVKIPQGYQYQLALQAIDNSRNRSTWAYSVVGTA